MRSSPSPDKWHGDTLRSETRVSTNPASSTIKPLRSQKPSAYHTSQHPHIINGHNIVTPSSSSISGSVKLLEALTGPYRRVEIIESWLETQAQHPPPPIGEFQDYPVATEGSPTIKAPHEDESVICGESFSIDSLLAALRAAERGVGLFEFSFPEFALHCKRLRKILIQLAGCIRSQLVLPEGVDPNAMRIWIHKTIPDARTLRHWINVILYCRDTHDSDEKLSQFCYDFEKQLRMSLLDEDDPKYFLVDPQFKCKKGPKVFDPRVGSILDSLNRIYDNLHQLSKIYPKKTALSQDLSSQIQSIQLDLSRRDAEGVPIELSPSLIRATDGLNRYLDTLLNRRDFIYNPTTTWSDLELYYKKFEAHASSLRLGITRTTLTTLLTSEINQYKTQKRAQEERRRRIKKEYLRVCREGKEGRKLARVQIKGMVERLRVMNEVERAEEGLEG